MINLAISIEDIIKKIDNIVWGIPLIALIIIVGIVLTILLKGIQFRKLGLAFKFLTEKEDGEGEVSSKHYAFRFLQQLELAISLVLRQRLQLAALVLYFG